MAFSYPVSLELDGRRCIVIGGGSVAEHKVRGLLEAGARVHVVATDPSDGIRELARRREIELVTRTYERGDLAGAFLAIAATDDGSVNAAVYEEARAERVLVNCVDDVDHCDFAAPSIVRNGDLAIAVSTGGKAPALAKRVRKRLETEFADGWGELVRVLAEARAEALPRRSVGFAEWAARWERALELDLLGLIRAGQIDEARRSVVRVLDDGPAAPSGKVWIVGAGPGDPGLITVRGREALADADVVVYDRLVDPRLIAGKASIYAGKRPGDHRIAQDEINDLLVALARDGKKVVRLKGGDPFVFGRGAEEAEALSGAGIPYEVVPAPTSAVAALASAGIPVTDRRSGSSVAIVTGHCAGDRVVDWGRLATSVDTIVVLMGLARLHEIAHALVRGGRDPATPAAIVENGTLRSQRVVEATLGDIADAAAREHVVSPAIVVVGDVVRHRARVRAHANDAAVTRA